MLDSEVVKLCVLGAGSVRCMPGVIGSFATYFGERPLEIRFWDADEERVDLFDRFARLCFFVNKCSHRLLTTDDPDEALEDATRVVIAVGGNCARKMREVSIVTAVAKLSPKISPSANVLSLVEDEGDWPHLSWPAQLSDAERMALPHRLLRYLHEDEYLHDFLKTYASTPFKSWLDD
jgi:hypothetical protein